MSVKERSSRKNDLAAFTLKEKTMHGTQKEVLGVLYENRILKWVTGCSAVFVLVWLGALCTNYWILVMSVDPEGLGVGTPPPGWEVPEGEKFLWSNSGLWRKCTNFGKVNNS